MRQVTRDELVQILETGLRDWATSLLRDLQHHNPERRLLARLTAAGLLADKLKQPELMVEMPEAQELLCVAHGGSDE